MTLPAFPTTPGPDLPVNAEYSAEVREARFGDGYRQEQGRDINHIDTALSLTWSNMKGSEFSTLVAFLEARKGYQRFTYTIPNNGETSKTWVCKKWTSQRIHHDVYTLNATFERRFDVE